jgi:RNA polymerase sigma-70 factor (ECF subfamily)
MPDMNSEQELLRAAQAGDEVAFERLITTYRGELQAHAYRMVGSVHDAEDVMQEAMLRAWRAVGRFEGRSSLRSWLYTITTNASLRYIERRPQRVLPIDFGPPTDPHGEVGTPLVESTWIEPYPSSPEARYEQRESVELAFTAAMQHLPPLQRAALILTDVLGFAPGEVAEALEATPASIYSALQRARKATEERLPDQTQQETRESLGDNRVKQVIDDFVEAWEATDFDRIRSLLTEDCVLAMPPWSEWFEGMDSVMGFLPIGPMRPGLRWKLVPIEANGQPAVAMYRSEGEGAALAADIMVLTLSPDGCISELDAFRDPKLFGPFGLPPAMD